MIKDVINPIKKFNNILVNDEWIGAQYFEGAWSSEEEIIPELYPLDGVSARARTFLVSKIKKTGKEYIIFINMNYLLTKKVSLTFKSSVTNLMNNEKGISHFLSVDPGDWVIFQCN